MKVVTASLVIMLAIALISAACGGPETASTPILTPTPTPIAPSTPTAPPTPGGGQSEALERYNEGALLQKQGRIEEAISKYDEAIRLNPEYARTYYNRGLAYRDLGQYQRAIQDYTEAILLDSQLDVAYASRAEAYIILYKDAEANDDIERLIQMGWNRDELMEGIEELRMRR